MPNSLSQKIDIFFQKVVAGFDATNITAKKIKKYRVDSGMISESGQTFNRPMPVMTDVVSGRDVTSSYNDIAEITVPSHLNDSHIQNIPFMLNGSEINNPHIMPDIIDGAKRRLSAKLDTMVANEIADKATMAVVLPGEVSGYRDLSRAEVIMDLQQARSERSMMVLNPRMASRIADDLSRRGTLNKIPTDALTMSDLPMIAGFETYRVQYAKTLRGSDGNGYLVDGVNQYLTPRAKTDDGIPVDNRRQTLVVKTGTNAAVGDFFTIAGVNAVGLVNKEDTGDLKTFRILDISGNTWEIAPSIIPADSGNSIERAYANVVTAPVDNAAITILNREDCQVSSFFEYSAVELLNSEYNVSVFSDTGKKVRKATTDSGITITLLGDSDIDTLSTKYRLMFWANPEVLNYELAGVILENQGA